MEKLQEYRHSVAHLLAAAVLELYPDVKRAIGPAIDNGFYYDFEFVNPISDDNLRKIEKKMRSLLSTWDTFSKQEVSILEAKKVFAKNPYKLELIEEFSKDGQKLTLYKSGEYVDLCKGGHVPSAKDIKSDSFKLTHTTMAYWRGDENKKQLTRIYGLAFFSKQELNDYIVMMAEAKKRDHTVLGEKLELFTHFDLVGKGLPIWLPKGEIIREEIEKFAIEVENKQGYFRVATPHIAKKELFLKSGHLPFYEDSMYPAMKMDDGEYYLKAMNCPFHHLIYSKKQRSYRDLPFRIAEYGTCYRNELSGALTGLLRVRILRMNDAHIYCTLPQIENEIKTLIKMSNYYFKTFGLEDYWFRLSLGDSSNKKKYIGEPKIWKSCEDNLRKVLVNSKVKFVEEKDEAAFYGPKIDVQFKNVYGREETLSTIQLDFAAKTRFGLTYIDKNGSKNNEVFVIHRAPLSVHERFMAFLIEHYAGKFPLWLAPEQVRFVTISDKFNGYADMVAEKLRKNKVRVHVDSRAESIGKKVREAQVSYIPLIVTVGEKEATNETLAIRTLDGKVKFGMKVDEFILKVTSLIESRELKVDV
tara:strand:- start:2203 stop:3957 length:1755 start_codon:yes stop_codon:yes gene_type:complete